MQQRVEIHGLEIIAVLTDQLTGQKRVFKTRNIVTNDGDEYYAYRGVNAQPPNDLFTTGAAQAFDGIMELGTAGNAPVKASIRSDMTAKVASSQKAMDATYPLRNDGDADNTGAGVDVDTYRVSYLTSEANSAGIDRLIITNPSPTAGDQCLMYALFAASFEKTSNDTLKVFVNHTMNGV